MALTLPCLTEECNGLAELGARGMWGCPVCHRAFSNDEMRAAHLPDETPEDREPPFDAWRDEQARTHLLSHFGGNRTSKGKRFDGAKKMPERHDFMET